MVKRRWFRGRSSNGPREYSIVGNRHPSAVAGHGITYDVDEATWTQWAAANPHIASSMKLVTDSEIDAARNVDPSTTHGFELGLQPPVNVDVPHAQQEDAVVTCTMGNWQGEPTAYRYQWMDGTTAVGTDSNVLAIGPNDDGHSMTCIVTAVSAAGSTEAPPSNAVIVVMPTRRAARG
jgi:hypothetical protein